MDIRRINLNLLLHLDTLLMERSVSRAAEKSYISQTAMSHILKQLRELFDDPLFIRKPHGLQPTQTALDLAPKIKAFLNASNEIFQEKEFTPHNEVLFFKVALAGHGEYIILPKLCAYLAQNAPKYSLQSLSLNEYLNLESLLATEVDFAIAPGFIEVGHNINHELLLEEEAICIMRKSHPLVHQDLTPQAYLETEQVDIKLSYMANENILYRAISEYQKRNIKVTVPNVINALEIVNCTDLIATVPKKLVLSLKDRYRFEFKPFPFSRSSFNINLYYHSRLVNYKPLQWIIDVIKGIVS